jgi:hypothetical protein
MRYDRYGRRNTGEKVAAVGLFIWVMIVLTAFVGWVMNIIAIATSDQIIFTGEMVMRIIGVFIPPIGAIMGLFV